jgi:hypothetical protein
MSKRKAKERTRQRHECKKGQFLVRFLIHISSYLNTFLASERKEIIIILFSYRIFSLTSSQSLIYISLTRRAMIKKPFAHNE